ncbi:hypothetical protein CMK14_04025 [Candidatus Poribacteria bacterium]|jgi:F0F1-type ATP synthase assembly protein I|nr:hypothetical protein [Candidatus Poribacteria bacterium]|tara:strand:+ start:171 stop:488 length:318 start_codon:yes stop_codon:yes gene_type:complete
MNLDDQSTGQERKKPRYSIAARQSALTSVGDLSTIGLTLVFAIVIGTFTGKWLGGKFGNQQLGLIIGFLFGTVAGFIQMYKSISRWNRSIEQQKGFEPKGKTNPD